MGQIDRRAAREGLTNGGGENLSKYDFKPEAIGVVVLVNGALTKKLYGGGRCGDAVKEDHKFLRENADKPVRIVAFDGWRRYIAIVEDASGRQARVMKYQLLPYREGG